MVCIAADMPCRSFPVAQPESEHFILLFEKFVLLKELWFGGDSPRGGILAIPNAR